MLTIRRRKVQTQLKMIMRDLTRLPALQIPDGYGIRTYRPGDEIAWAHIMNHGLGEWTAKKCRESLTGKPQFLPDGLFFVTWDDKPVASACAWRESPDEWEHGYLHMVCVLPEHRSKGLGIAVSLAVLHFFRAHGFRDVALTTDDFRIPAIKAYLRLGFEPVMCDETHPQRWEKVFSEIKQTNR